MEIGKIMDNKNIARDFKLSTDGVGIVLYSADAIVCNEGENYFQKEFSSPEKVAEHIARGDIIGFNTGGSGEYNIMVREGYPSEQILNEYPVAIRLALDVKGGKVYIIDLLWLTEWSDEVPEEQTIDLDDGVYHVTVITKRPESGIWGDNQDIYLYFQTIDEMPKLSWKGVPYLFN